MRKEHILQTDSIAELADFWDTHDITDFEDELEEVKEPVFERRKDLRNPANNDVSERFRMTLELLYRVGS